MCYFASRDFMSRKAAQQLQIRIGPGASVYRSLLHATPKRMSPVRRPGYWREPDRLVLRNAHLLTMRSFL